jgi:hypothetical protein
MGAFQAAVAGSIACLIATQAPNRRPFRATERSTFYHGSIRFRYRAVQF